MQVSLSSNGHEKTSKFKKLLISKRRIGILKKLPKPPGERERTIVKFKKLLISKRRIGILENYLNKVKIVRVCDFNIFEIPILTVV